MQTEWKLKLDYPIELHYSQTYHPLNHFGNVLDYPIELHYSQTYYQVYIFLPSLDYPIELHYSQTNGRRR